MEGSREDIFKPLQTYPYEEPTNIHQLEELLSQDYKPEVYCCKRNLRQAENPYQFCMAPINNNQVCKEHFQQKQHNQALSELYQQPNFTSNYKSTTHSKEIKPTCVSNERRDQKDLSDIQQHEWICIGIIKACEAEERSFFSSPQNEKQDMINIDYIIPDDPLFDYMTKKLKLELKVLTERYRYINAYCEGEFDFKHKNGKTKTRAEVLKSLDDLGLNHGFYIKCVGYEQVHMSEMGKEGAQSVKEKIREAEKYLESVTNKSAEDLIILHTILKHIISSLESPRSSKFLRNWGFYY